MAYVKWVRNADQTDWVSELQDEEGNTVLKMGEPTELSAEDKKKYEGRFVFEESSAAEAKEYQEARANKPVVGSDIAGSAPTFENAQGGNQPAAREKANTDQD